MSENEDIEVNHIDGNIVLMTSFFRNLNKYWINEINMDGDSFNYDSQDAYRYSLEKLMLHIELIEKLNPETEKEERIILMEDLEEAVIENIKLFENHHSLFEDLPRKKLLIKELRQRKYPESTKDDNSIFETFIALKEIQNRNNYYNSELYKNIGFLEHNYHDEINQYALYIQKNIKKRFKVDDQYDPNYLGIFDTVFFNMGIVHHIHKNFSGILFEEISELELYYSLNLQNTIQKLKIKNTERAFYLIHNLKELVPISLQEGWLKGILKEIDKSKKHYKSKYRIVAGSNITADQKNFKEELDTIFKDIIIPLVS